MRQKMLIFIAVIVVLFAALYFVTAMKDNQATESDNNSNGTEDQDSVDSLYQNQITPDELDNELDEEGEAFVYYYQPDCSHCQRVSPILIPMAEEEFDLDMKELDLKEYDNKWDTYDIEATPTLVYYQEGEEVDRISGAAETDKDIETQYEDFLDKHAG